MYHSGHLILQTPVINEENTMSHFLEVSKKITNEKDFGLNDYDAEALIIQLGYSRFQDNSPYSTYIQLFEEKVELIEKLNTSEYSIFWEYYGIKPIIRNGDITLNCGDNFDFKFGQDSYKNHIMERLIENIE